MIRLVMSNEQPKTAAFGARLKQARQRAGYRSQPALARALGINPMTVHRHEAGIVPPKPETLRAYAVKLRVTEQWLLYGAGDPEVAGVVESYLTGRRGMDTDPYVAECLRSVPWAQLGAGALDEIDVHEMRLTIEKVWARRRPSTHDTRRLPGDGRAVSDDGPRTADTPRNSHTPARARA